MRREFKEIEVSEEKWYDEAVSSRAGWSTLCRDGLERRREIMGTFAPVAVRDVMCEVCSRTFRQRDKARHKCMEERTYKGTNGCNPMFKLFRSKEGLQFTDV